jgi:cytochrome c oxidase subunit 2
MWFIPGIEGSYDLFCAEYCGLDHSYMNSIVKVMPKDDFESLIADTSAVVPVVSTETSLADQGFEVLSRNGCIACHSSDGSKLVGPSYKDLWGTMQKVVTGREKRSVLVDKEYIERSIFEPDADLVEGFNKGLMQSYEGTVSDEDVDLIIAYLKTLND